MKKHNVDSSLMQVSGADISWAHNIIFNNDALVYKNTLDDHYLQYFPPVQKKLNEKIAVINFLELKDSVPLDILDISTGCGHLMALMQHLGHRCQGTEIPQSIEILQSLYNYYKLQVLPLTVEKQIPINLSNTYDVITSLRTVFNENWTKNDWIFLRDNLLDFLNPSGKIFIKTNIKFIPNSFNDASRVLGPPIKGWQSLTYLIEK